MGYGRGGIGQVTAGRGKPTGSGGSMRVGRRGPRASCPTGGDLVEIDSPEPAGGGGKIRDRGRRGSNTRSDRTRLPRAESRQQGAAGSQPAEALFPPPKRTPPG